MTSQSRDADDEVVARLRAICGALPEVVEVEAWTGTSWRIRTATFAHVLAIADGWPPAYAKAFGTYGSATVVTFQAEVDERAALLGSDSSWVAPPWRPGIVGTVLDDTTDWVELTELLVDSYCLLAPASLARRARARGNASE